MIPSLFHLDTVDQEKLLLKVPFEASEMQVPIHLTGTQPNVFREWTMHCAQVIIQSLQKTDTGETHLTQQMQFHDQTQNLVKEDMNLITYILSLEVKATLAFYVLSELLTKKKNTNLQEITPVLYAQTQSGMQLGSLFSCQQLQDSYYF